MNWTAVRSAHGSFCALVEKPRERSKLPLRILAVDSETPTLLGRPYPKHMLQMSKHQNAYVIITPNICYHLYWILCKGVLKIHCILTPGMAHSPQSFLLMDTNSNMGCFETAWETCWPAESRFHLGQRRREKREI